jgi:hypothetical protein
LFVRHANNRRAKTNSRAKGITAAQNTAYLADKINDNTQGKINDVNYFTPSNESIENDS